MWQVLVIGLIIGAIIGYLIARFSNANVKKQIKTIKKLEETKQQLEQQQKDLEQHFQQSAELMKNLAQNYQALYQHFGQASLTLLPNTEKPCFAELLTTTQAEQAKTEQKNTEPTLEQTNIPPRDYSEGSSGLFKSTK